MSRRNATAPQRVLSASFRSVALLGCFFLALVAHASTLTVTNLNDSGSNSLRAQIAAANSGDTIVFQSGLSGTITLASTLTISQNLTIQGPGANVITVSGNHAVGVSEITSGTVTISGLTIANGNASGGGGGILMDISTTLTVNGVTFSGNTTTAGNGGGIENSQGTLTVSNSTFSGNSAGTLGGAIENSNSTMTVSNSTFSGNSADSGGAINNLSSTATVSNSTFSGNSATFGGAINNQVNTLTVSNSIFTGNSAAQGGGISNFATANIGNSVFYNNPAASGPDCDNCTSDTNEVTTDPKLLPLGNYGGTTQAMLPLPGSSAICAGSTSLVPGGTTTDQRGFLLAPSNCGNGGVDAGAVQSAYDTVVTLSDSSDSLCGIHNDCSLRDLIGSNNIDIDFAPGLTSISHPGTITLGSTLPAITGAVNIVGPGANQLSISGGGSTAVGSVLTVNSGAQGFLYGLTIANGNTNSGGGGINNSGTLTVMASAISGNQASNSAGGGINNSGTLTLTSSTVSGSTASANGGGIYDTGTLTLTGSTVSGNTASGGSGGGIYNTGTLTLTGSTVSGNTVSNNTIAFGGGIASSGTPALANSIAVGNSVTGIGILGFADLDANYTDNGGNQVSNNTSATSTINPKLSPLQLNGIGATVPTMIPLPGSPAICAGLKANIPSGTTTDERGYPNTNSTYTGYSSGSPCVDAGAVQTNYTSTAFVQQPTNTLVSAVITPSPTAEVLETNPLLSSSNTDAVSGIPVTLTLATGSGTLGGTLTQTTSGGVATFGNLTVSALGASDKLATNAITVVGTDILAAQNSSAFEVIGPVTQFGLSATSPVAIGGTSSVIVTAEDVNGDTNPTYTGTVHFTSTDLAAGLPGNYTFTSGDNGQQTFSVTLHTLNSQTVTATDTVTSSITGVSNAITVNPAVTATTVIASKGLEVNFAISSFTPVIGSNGVPPLRYSVSPLLPAGVAMSPSNGSVSGLPTFTDGGNTYTVTVTDANGATATATFSLAINGSVTATTTFAESNLTQNHAATSFIPVTGSGGTTPLSYSVSPPLPTGLSISSSTGTITGTPTVTSSDIIHTVTVTDANGQTAMNTFTLGVNSAVTATQAVPTTSLTVQTAAISFTPVTGGGGTGALSYSVAPPLPAGLSMSSSTGAITGTPTVSGPAGVYTVTVTDTNGATATNTFSLAVNSAVTATQAVPTTSLTVLSAATPFTPVTGSGGTGSLSYSVSPSLPATLTMNSSTGAITGTPAAPSTVTSYTVTVTDANGATATANFSLTVNQASQTINFTAPTTPVTYGVSPITLSATGGASTNAVTFTIDGTSTGTGSISGATLTVTGAGSIVIDANQAGNTNYSAAAQVQRTLVVNQASQTINFTAPTSPVTYGVSPILLAATGGASGNAIVFTVASGVCTIASGSTTVTITGAGSCVINANQAGNTNYTAAPQVQRTIVVNTAAVSIGTSTITESYGNISSSTATVTGISSGATPTGTLSYSFDSGTATNVTLSSGQAPLSIPSLTAGAHTLSLTYGGDTNYAAITTPVTAHFTVTQAGTTVAGTAVTQSYGATPTSTITVTGFLGAALPTGTVSYSIDSGATTPVTLASGTVSLPVPGTLLPGPHSIALSYSGDTNYSSSTGSITFTTSTATLTVTAANASKAYGTANPTLTASYTGQQNGDTFNYIVSTAATAGSPVGPYDIVPSAVTGVHSSYYTIHLVNGTLTITKAATTASLVQTLPATTGVGTGVNTTFTATVLDATPGSTGTPTGSVQFFDGSTSLGTSALTAGVATITTSFSTNGTHVITVQYLGDANFNTVTSAAFNEVVVTPGFNVVANPNTLSIVHGQSGSAVLTLTPFGNYQGTLTLSCSGLPAFSACQFTPASITFAGNNVAQTMQLQIFTLNVHDAAITTASGLLWLPAGMLACFVAIRRRKLRSLLMLAVAALALATMTGCGSGATFITPTGADTVTVTATGASSSGTITQTATITVTITE